ncbi:unnamed protein product [Haemonchus placei]|uniref:Prefoldin subunit 3 n=1 Tax=Haemonchus placei TaxID=6290 RepID=A0A158QRW5_HAEPC|nr:unnamed protein product [Haemonchus placei]
MVEKLPDFKNSLALLDVLIDKKEKDEPFETTYLVAEEVYTKATVRKPEKVSIWLGAGIMVEYELDKAKELLVKNQGNVQKFIDYHRTGFPVLSFAEFLVHPKYSFI